MIKGYERLRKQNKNRPKIPKKTQGIVEADTVYKDGISKLGNRYNMTYRFRDVNYSIVSKDEKINIFLDYSGPLNSLDSSTMSKIAVSNRKIDIRDFKSEILIPYQNDELSKYHEEHNQMLLDKVFGSEDILQKKHLTVTIFKNNHEEAKNSFSRIIVESSSHLTKLGSSYGSTDVIECLKILHDFFRSGEEEFINFDLNNFMRKGHSFEDAVCPKVPIFEHKYLRIGDRFGRVLCLSDYAHYIKDSSVSEVCSPNRNLVFSVDVVTMQTDEAVREVESRLSGVKTNITDWQGRQNNNNNSSTAAPYDMEQQRREVRGLLNGLTVRDRGMMSGMITLVHLANSLEEPGTDTETLMTVARKHICEFTTLASIGRQLDGLNTALPLGINKLNIVRILLTKSAAVFIPFRTQDITDKKGIWFGQHATVNNLILYSKKNLLDPNAFQLGVPDSGKLFLAKGQIVFIAFSTNNDILICDPGSEHTTLIEELDGEIVHISVGSEDHINAIDVVGGYGDTGDPVGDKSQLMISLFEQLDRDGIKPVDRSIIDRCIASVYSDYKRCGLVPALNVLRKKLSEQPELEAHSLTLKLELSTNGSLDAFVHETNADVKNHITSYDIFNLGKQLKTVGLLAIIDAMINRVSDSRRKGKRTHILLDELHVVSENEESASLSNSAQRQFRKCDAFPTGITQNVEYLLDSTRASIMISSSEFVAILSQSYQDREELAKLLNTSEEQLSYIMSVQSGRGLIKCGGSLVPLINKFPEDIKLYQPTTTKPESREDV